MSSAVGFTPKAQREFSAFETSVQELILDYLDILAEDPVRRSERGGSALAGHQIYRFPGASDASISLEF
jgi:mRNA-degrading endonuclease RelE of RelBE toxin-antitoxin system